MAMASLCAKASHSRSGFPECVALIVDHKSRPESTEEAFWVAQQLLKHTGIKSHILSVQWPEGIRPSKLGNFEKQARTLRYQAIGIACREHGLDSFLVAHQSDDQAETLISRIIYGNVRAGLRGIQPVKEIPECYGLHGVHQSGGLENMPDTVFRRGNDLPMEIETGGVQVLRPLLQFSKERLTSTCLENKMPWAEDSTNKDKTFTVRNAIRHILRHHYLPTALRKKEIVNLSLRLQNRSAKNMEAAEQLLSSCKLKLDLQQAALCVSFSRELLEFWEDDSNRVRTVTAVLIGRLAEMVSPKDTVSPGGLDGVIDRVLPTLKTPNWSGKQSSTFVWAGVQFQPILSQSLLTSLFPFAPMRQHTWLLFRQPYAKDEFAKGIIRLDGMEDGSRSSATQTNDGFRLYDGRFWIRVINPWKCTLILRSLRIEDMPHIRTAIISAATKARLHKFDSIIHAIKPAAIRWTLPALVMVGDDGKEHVIALPSLGLAIGSRAQEYGVEWDIRYKKINVGAHDIDSIVRGL
ncbi:hypothetical protein AOQ84DRAFT_294103 [Glonium stellatum]|uniref:tRNA(Ile)-lysidine synthetase n=1 Tax=Glonium stellatum TaxID=574774 RepID=A0A8E2JSW6_9PEZI|nr:hypothetical protein AOQ84DRAFT_294103 [Glonium stellatum]